MTAIIIAIIIIKTRMLKAVIKELLFINKYINALLKARC